MRKLETDDMFLLSEIADKMDIVIDTEGKTQEAVGAELLIFMAKKAHKAKVEIKQLIATLTDKTPEEVSKMSPKEMLADVKDVLTQDGVLDFFK